MSFSCSFKASPYCNNATKSAMVIDAVGTPFAATPPSRVIEASVLSSSGSDDAIAYFQFLKLTITKIRNHHKETKEPEIDSHILCQCCEVEHEVEEQDRC
ncbi:hypothetical protein E2542_SST16993 [Spatholobus suberectus]|nr:hypothetical protein E2542_SST16993 [Spatholobus suberectus]